MSEQPAAALPPADILELTLEMAGSLDARTVIQRILERSLTVAGADRATLSSLQGETLVIEATVGLAGAVTWVGRGYDSGALMRQPLVVELLATRRTILGGAMATSQAMPEFRSALDRVRHTALVPLLEATDLAGMLVLSRFDDRPFEQADIPNLSAIGALAGLALRNAKLYEEATSSARRLQAAADAATDVAALQDLPALMQRLIAHACTSTGADAGAVMRVEGRRGVVEATSGGAPAGSSWPLDDAVMAAVDAGRPIQVSTAHAGLAENLAAYASPYRHALFGPMRFSGELLGIIVLGRVKGRGTFSREEIAALQQFATLAAVVLHNGRLVHRLREAEAMKSEFMNIAVHEMRGPLTVIEGYTDLLMRERVVADPTIAEQLEVIRRQAARARDLAEDLLILARLESDELGVDRVPFSLRDAVTAAADTVRPRAALRGGRVVVRADEDVTARGDPALVDRVVSNLLANAIAYSEAAPEVGVTVGTNGAMATVTVQDTGPGIPAEERERVFERFARGSHSRGVSGSGLGLYLSRECARRMDGDLVLDANGAGPGSRFVLTLPAG